MIKFCLKKISVGIFMLAFSCSAVSAQNVSAHEKQKKRLEVEIAQIDAQLKRISAESTDAIYHLSLLDKKLSNRQELVQESDRKIRELDNSIRLKQGQINKLKARVDTLEHYFNKLVRSAYKNRDVKVWYMYLLASDNLSQAYRRYGYFKNMASQMKIEADQIAVSREQLEEEKSRLQQLRMEQGKIREERRAELKQIKADQEEVAKVVQTLNKDKKKYQQQLEKKRKEVEALNRKIEKLVREAIAAAEAAKTPSSSKSSKGTAPRKPVDMKLSGKFSSNKGKLPWPVEGPVVDKFGQHYHPVYKKLKLPFNNGISIAVSEGTEVLAVFDGVVKQIVVMPGYNQCVLVQHGSYFSFYCKLKNTSVKPGDTVKLGQVIGQVDSINSVSQLHFQIWKGTKPQDPETWLQ